MGSGDRPRAPSHTAKGRAWKQIRARVRFMPMMLSPYFRFPFADANKLSVFNLTQNSKMKPFRNSLTSPGVIMAAPHSPLPIKSVREKKSWSFPPVCGSRRTMTNLYGDVFTLLFKRNFYSDDRCNDCMHGIVLESPLVLALPVSSPVQPPPTGRRLAVGDAAAAAGP